jgi:dTDP-4-dehydrorhamnose reductase
LELARKGSLIEWFLARKGGIRGFTEAIYTGLTTTEMSRVIEKVLVEHPDLSGVWQVASEKINKYDLLTQFSEKLGRDDVSITPDDSVRIDRSLLGLEFGRATGYDAPGWDAMLAELALEVKARKRQGSE